MKIVSMLTDEGYTYNGIAVEGWQSYQEALDEQKGEYGYTSKPERVIEVWYKGEKVFNRGV